MVIDARIPMSGNPLGFYDVYSTGFDRGQQQKANALAMQQAETGDKARTAQMLAKGVLSSADPASAYSMALEQARRMGMNVEGLPAEWGPDAELAVKIFASDERELTAKQREMEAAGLSPEDQRKAWRIHFGIDPDANAEMRGRTGDAPKIPTGYRWKADGSGIERIPGFEDRKGMTVTLPDGTVISESGGSPLGRSATNETEKSLVANEVLSSNLKRVGELVGWDAEKGKISEEARRAFTYEGQFSAGTTRIRDKMEGVPIIGDLVEPSEEQRKFAQKRQVIMQGIDQMFNDYRQEITGAAAAVQELERLKKTFLNSDMGPDEFEAVFAETIRKMDRIRSVYVQLLQRGYDTKTARGGAALDRILSGQATIEDYPPAGGAVEAAGGLESMSDEELMRRLNGGN